MKRPKISLSTLTFVVALVAFVPGVGLVSRLDGSSLGYPQKRLEARPLKDNGPANRGVWR